MNDEQRLIRAARAGDTDAAEALVRRHFARAWRAAYAITGRREAADDAVQDAFERVFRTLDRFDDARPLAPWLHRIVVNCALSGLRGVARTRSLSQTLSAGPLSDPHLRASVSEALEAMSTLDADKRAVVALRLLLGYTSKETAEILGTTEGTIHSRLSRALEQMRVALGVHDV